MAYQIIQFMTNRVAVGSAATPCLRASSLPSLAALRSSLLEQVDRLNMKESRVPLFTRPSCGVDDELCEEEQSTRTSVKAERRSPKAAAVDSDRYYLTVIGQALRSRSSEPASRSIPPLLATSADSLRAAFARWVRGHTQGVRRLEKSSAWRNGLSEAEHKHLEGTWASLRLPGREKVNRRLVRRFQNLNEFAWWSIRNGFSLHSEVKLINPRIVEHVVVQRRSKIVWLDSVTTNFEYQLPWKHDPESLAHEWITAYDVVWTPHHRLRAKKQRTLTPYGEKRLKRTKRGSLRGRCSQVRYQGRTCSVAELARLPESVVSDKVIAKRLEEGWNVDEAVTTPRGSRGRPRKFSAENDKA